MAVTPARRVSPWQWLARLSRTRTFRSLAQYNYRLFFAGQIVSVVGTWMQRVAQDWLILTRSGGSGLALGIAMVLQFGPVLLLGLWGGVLVDRWNRRTIIVFTQVGQAVLAVALAGLCFAGLDRLWLVYLMTLALGVVTVLDTPARQAFIAELVEPKDYVNAQSLGSTMNNAGRLIGPAIGGILIAGVGVGWAFLINGLSFAAVLVGLLRMDKSALRTVRPAPRRPGEAREGLRYVLDRPALRAQMVLVLVVSLLGQNFRVVLPLLTTGTFHAGPRAYGYLTAMLGLGAVIGALVTASRAHATSWSVALSCIAFGVVNLLTAAAPSLVVAYAVMVVMGVANITFNTYARTVLQVNTERRMHGRVLALHNLVFQGTTPLGGPLMGWICQAAGARLSFVIAGAAPLVAVALLLPQLRHTSSGTPDPPVPDPPVPNPPAPNPSAPVRPSRSRAQQPVEPVPPPGPDL